MKRIKYLFTFLLCAFALCLLGSCNNDTNTYYDSDLKEYTGLSSDTVLRRYSDFKELETIFSEGTHYLYVGKPTCPWCQQYVPYYDEYGKTYDETIYYYNAEYVKGTYETVDDEGNVVLNVNEDYQYVVDYLSRDEDAVSKGYVKYNSTLTDSTGKTWSFLWIYVPRLFKIVDGEIVGVSKCVDGHEIEVDDNGNYYLPTMTDDQIASLKTSLDTLFNL